MISISKKKFKHAFKTKMYSLYAQPVEEASKDEIFRVLWCVIKDLIDKDTAIEMLETIYLDKVKV